MAEGDRTPGGRPRGPDRRLLRAVLACTALLACSTAGADSLCDRPARTGTLARAVDESSGLAASRRHDGVLWTHNDSGGEPEIFAVDTAGRLIGRVRVAGAENTDWEDLALGPCPAGDCLYIADTGDNRERRSEVVVYRVPEPEPGDTVTARAERFVIRYPDGPIDVEALYVLPSGDLFLISKGRSAPVTVFRYPAPLRAGDTVVVEAVQPLTDAAVAIPDQVTGAAASPDGRWVAVRTYTSVQLYRVEPDNTLRAAADPPGISLMALAEPQGEAVAIREDGTLFFTSEAGLAGIRGSIASMRCTLD